MGNLVIQRLQPKALAAAMDLFAQAVYAGNAAEAQAHLADHADGGSDTLLAYVDEQFAGFVTIRWQSNNLRFRAENIPFIHHLEVFDPFQRQGVASRLLDEAEQLIATRAAKAGITVGLFAAYGLRNAYTPSAVMCRMGRVYAKVNGRSNAAKM